MTINALGFFTVLAVCVPQGNGWCAYPCSKGNVTLKSLTDGTIIQQRFSVDRTTMINTVGSLTRSLQCVVRSGPFYSIRFFNGTHYNYFCTKDTIYDRTFRVRILYRNENRYFNYPPEFCDVCDGNLSLLRATMELRDGDDKKDCDDVTPPPLGCDIPKVCRATKPEGFDDGLCCNPEESYN